MEFLLTSSDCCCEDDGLSDHDDFSPLEAATNVFIGRRRFVFFSNSFLFFFVCAFGIHVFGLLASVVGVGLLCLALLSLVRRVGEVWSTLASLNKAKSAPEFSHSVDNEEDLVAHCYSFIHYLFLL